MMRTLRSDDYLRIGRLNEAARRLLARTLLNQPGSLLGLVRIRLEEHKNDYAGDRNVEPNGERPACDSAVHHEPARQREKERRQHHRQDDDGKDYVAA